MMKFRLFFFLILGMSLAISCNKKEGEVEQERLSYPFTKEGTLTLKNADGSPLQTVDIEFAETSAETSQGLMDRDSMAENQGMLFLMQPAVQTFYMKNTRIPLDLVYISSDSLVVDIQQGVPYKLETIPSDTISQYVLELNKGMAAKWGIKENETKVSWQRD